MPSSHSGTQGYLIDRRLLLWNPSAQGCCRPRPPHCPLTGGLSDWDHLPPADWGGLASDGWRQVIACEEFSHASVVTVHHQKQQNLAHSAVRRRGTPRSSAPRTARTSGGAAPAPRVAPHRPVAAPAGRCTLAGQAPPRNAPQHLRHSARTYDHVKFYLRWLLGAGT